MDVRISHAALSPRARSRRRCRRRTWSCLVPQARVLHFFRLGHWGLAAPWLEENGAGLLLPLHGVRRCISASLQPEGEGGELNSVHLRGVVPASTFAPARPSYRRRCLIFAAVR